jgi:cytochrome c2
MREAVRWRLVAIALVLVVYPLAPARAQQVFGPSQDALAGARVFGTMGCATCHAVHGVGGRIGPDLGRIPGSRSFYDLGAAMWNHLPRMVAAMQERGIPRPHLQVRQTEDLIAFLYTLDYFDAPGDPAVGARVFMEKRCIVCHQVRSVGGVVGPNLDFLKPFGSPIFVAAALWNHGPQMTEAMKTVGIERPALTGTELRDLAAYIAPVYTGPQEGPAYVLPGRASTGQRRFVEKRCAACHGVDAPGRGVGPSLAERGERRSLLEFAAAMWNKAPSMSQAMAARGFTIPELRPDEMADIVAYLYSVRYFADPGDVRTGWKVARSKGCLRCHPGQGRVASDLTAVKGLGSPAAVITALWNHAAVAPADRGALAEAWPELRPEEMPHLVALLQSSGRSR